jgi:biotin transport system ATP-binding protein
LDIPTTRALQKRLNQLDQTLIHITHDPSVIADYDRVIWIEAGKVIADGTPDRVLPDYLHVMEAEDADAHL